MESVLPDFLLPYWPTIRGVVIGIVIFVAGWIASRILSKITLRILQNRKIDLALSRFLSRLIFYAVLVATLIAALGSVGVQTTSLVAVFASAGLAIGLALQGTLAHFAAGMMILFMRPIRIGDFAKVAGMTGTVEDIGLFATTLITLDNEKVIIPNGKIGADSIVNFTALGTRRGHVDVGLTYGTDIQRAQQVLQAAAERAGLVLTDPAPGVAFIGFGESSLQFRVLTYCESPNYLAMLHNVRGSIYEGFKEAGIEIPFNQIVVHYADGERPAKAA